MSLITPEAIQSQSPNDLSLAKGQNPPAIVERADRFGALSLPKESFRLEALSIKAPKGFAGDVTLVCDASGAIPLSNKVEPSKTVQKWKIGEKRAPRPPAGEWKLATTRDGYEYWAPSQKAFLQPGEAKKLASATNAVPTVKSPAAVPTADPKKVSPAPNKEGGSGNVVAANGKVKDKRGVTFWCPDLGDKPLPKPSPDAVLSISDVGNYSWWIPGGSSTIGKCPPKIIVGPR